MELTATEMEDETLSSFFSDELLQFIADSESLGEGSIHIITIEVGRAGSSSSKRKF